MNTLAQHLPPAWAEASETVYLGEPGQYSGPGTLVRADCVMAHLPSMRDAMRARYAGEDARALLSQWSKYYFSLYIGGAVAVAVLLRRPLRMDWQHCHLILRDGMPQALVLPADALGELTDAPSQRYRSLCVGHLMPYIEAMATAVRVAPRVLWSNVGHTLEYALSQLEAQPLAASDRAYLLERGTLLDTDMPNPLLHAIRFVTPNSPQLANPLRVRRVCCLRYLLPGEELLCTSCPLLLKLSDAALAEQLRLRCVR